MSENKRNSEDDLTKMSLGDHLEELRARMILMLLGIFVGLLAGLMVGKHLVEFLQTPYNQAVNKVFGKEYTGDSEGLPSPQKILVRFHVAERNVDLIHDLKPGDSFLAYMEFCEDDPNNPGAIQYNPFSEPAGRPLEGLKTIRPSEGFLIYLKVSLVFGIILASPWLFWQIWAFVSAGLYRHERKFVHVVSPVSAVLFVIGCVFFLLIAAPNVMYFFIKFDASMGAQSNWTLQYYMDMVLMLTLIFGAAFQSPIAIVFAERMGLVTVKALASSRKYAFLGCFVVSAIATPPEPISQVALAIPLYILYEGSIIVCRIWKRKREG